MQHTDHGAICSKSDVPVLQNLIPNLIQTNRDPSPEASLTKDSESLSNDSLRQHDNDIAHFQSVLDRHLQNGQELDDYHRDHKAVLLSPIQRFPSELLSHIFLLSFPTFKGSKIKAFRRAVMLPGQVCKYWRDVVLSTPKLWSEINIRYNIGGNSPAYTALAQSWLARSGNCPLSIKLTVTDSKPTCPTFFDLLSQSDRWEYADIDVAIPALDMLRTVKHRLPSLRAVSIQCAEPGLTEPLPFDAFEVAPQLRSLTIGYRVPLTGFCAPWSQLTHCDMHFNFDLDIQYILEVFQQSPNLVECSVVVHSTRQDSDATRVIRHDRLRVLSIRIYDVIEPLFDQLSLPALHALSSVRLQGCQPQSQSGLTSLLSRSDCSLSRLHLDCAFEQLEDCLQLSPSLDELELRDDCARISLTESLLSRLTRRKSENGHEGLLPNLRVIVLDIYTISIGEALIEMIESRRHFDASEPQNVLLESVSLYLTPHQTFDSSINSRLDSCREGGLILNINELRLENEGFRLTQTPL